MGGTTWATGTDGAACGFGCSHKAAGTMEEDA